MAVVYPGGVGITTITDTELEASDATFPCMTIAGAAEQTDYSDIKKAVMSNPGSIGGTTPATSIVTDDIQIGDSIPFSDSSGTLTLQNVDALDATTVATLNSDATYFSNLLIWRVGGSQAIIGGGYNFDMYQKTANITAVASVTIPIGLLAGEKMIGAQIRIDSALAAGEIWDAEWNNGGAVQSIVTGAAVDKNTKVSVFFDENANSAIATGTTHIVITKNGGGAFTAQGTLSVIAFCAFLGNPAPAA